MKTKKLSVERHQSRVGFIFLIPYLIGLVYFFIIPFAKTVFYSFNDVSVRTARNDLNAVSALGIEI